MSDKFLRAWELFDQEKFQEAALLFMECNEKNDAETQVLIGHILYNKIDPPRLEDAFHWFYKAALQGDSDAEQQITLMYALGEIGDRYSADAIKWYQQAAHQGNSTAQFLLGDIYCNGRGVEKDLNKALFWYNKSAEQGDSEAQWRLGTMYHLGKGISKDLQNAYKWYHAAAEQGSSDGQWLFGYLYEHGEGVKQDLKKAFHYYSLAANQDDDVGMFYLAQLYEKGIFVDPDPYTAFDLYAQAAVKGHSTSLLCAGNMCETGVGTEKSIIKAVEYWKKASNCEMAEGEASYKLGYAYYDGYGVERNLEKAKEYFERAIKQGYHCSYALNMVKGELGELDDSNKMREYADGLIKKHIPNTKLYQQISKDLQSDFGDMWNIICRETKKFLETGMFTYFSLYSLGPHIYGNMDFSASITPMFKALEKELGKYLYSGYIEFLKKKEVSPNTFPQKRSHIKRISSTELAYRDPSDLTEFTLGNLHLTVGLERKPQFAENDTFKYTIDQTILDYLNSIFKKDAFGEAKREREITDYIISLTQEVKAISDSLRNPAAHDQAMKIQKAEVCGNYIIKVQRLLIDFLEKIKFPQNEKDKK